MATPMKAYSCRRCPFKTSLMCRINDHTLKGHNLTKKQEVLLNCARAIESLKCFRCNNFETHNLAHLKHHIKANHTLSKFETELHDCENCSFQTYSNYLFLRHKLFNLCKNHDYCSYWTPFSYDLQGQILAKHTDQFDCEEVLREHVIWRKRADRKKIKFLQCDYCTFRTAVRRSLNQHVIWKHSEKVKCFECNQCSFKTAFRNTLILHVFRKHSDDTPENIKRFRCAQSSHKTDVRSTVECDIISNDSKPEKIQWFQCEHCPYKYTVEAYLKRHVECNHGKMRTLQAID